MIFDYTLFVYFILFTCKLINRSASRAGEEHNCLQFSTQRSNMFSAQMYLRQLNDNGHRPKIYFTFMFIFCSLCTLVYVCIFRLNLICTFLKRQQRTQIGLLRINFDPKLLNPLSVQTTYSYFT